MVNIKLTIHNDPDHEMTLTVLREFGAKVEYFSSGITVELPAGTELVAHDDSTTNLTNLSHTLTATIYQLPDGPRFGHLQKTIGEFGSYSTVDKIEIHLETL